MPGLVRASTTFFLKREDVDGRDKPGNDAESASITAAVGILLALGRSLRKLDDVLGRRKRSRDQGGDALSVLWRDLEAHAFGLFQKRRLPHGGVEGLAQRLDPVGRHAGRRHQRPPELRVTGKE